MRRRRAKHEYKIGEKIPVPSTTHVDYNVPIIFPYGDPIVLHVAERMMAQLVMGEVEQAEKSLKLVDDFIPNDFDEWRKFGVIYLLVAGMGFKWTETIRDEFRKALIKFVKVMPQYPPRGYLLLHYRYETILKVLNLLLRYEKVEWGMKVPIVGGYLKGWAGRWCYNWAIHHVNENQLVIEKFRIEQEPHIKEGVKNDGNIEVSTGAAQQA
jgi:hypothetical protein